MALVENDSAFASFLKFERPMAEAGNIFSRIFGDALMDLFTLAFWRRASDFSLAWNFIALKGEGRGDGNLSPDFELLFVRESKLAGLSSENLRKILLVEECSLEVLKHKQCYDLKN